MDQIRQVYLAEDSPTQALRVRRILSSIPNLEVHTFGDGLDAYEAVQKSPPDLLLMDVIMPTLEGLAVSRLIKFQEGLKEVPILIFSSITEDDFQAVVASVGADAYLRKPFSSEDLLSAVERLLPSSIDTV